MKIKNFIKIIIFACFIFQNINLNASQDTQEVFSKYKFAYFDMNYESDVIDYKFLSSALTRSMRSVLSNFGFITLDSKGYKIEDIYNRDNILKIGKELLVDLILCGRYYIVGENEKARINLIISVYDIDGGENVITRLITGDTGQGMFEMIDKAGVLIKESVAEYFKRRNEILLEARKRRIEENRLSQEERIRRRKQSIEEGFKELILDKLLIGAWFGLGLSGFSYYEGSDPAIQDFNFTREVKLAYKLSLSLNYFTSKTFGLGLDIGYSKNKGRIDGVYNSGSGDVGFYINPKLSYIFITPQIIIKTANQGGFYFALGLTGGLNVNVSEETSLSLTKNNREFIFGFDAKAGYMFALGKFRIPVFLNFSFFPSISDDEGVIHMKNKFSILISIGLMYSLL